jgi:general secretion pathway protein A
LTRIANSFLETEVKAYILPKGLALAKRETFYSTFYGFSSSPFHVTPAPDNLFLTEAHKHAIGAICYGVLARKGFVVITGEVGVGKTSVLRASLERVATPATKIVYLFNPRLSPAELYHTILADLGERLEARQDVVAALQHLLLNLYNGGMNVVLAIDEAQNMPEQTLEDLRVLSNLETRSDKLLQIVLVGQPELDALLSKPSLRQLQQRIAVRATIPALSLKQSFRYVRYRLAVAGRAKDNPLFSFAALCYIACAAGGNPRKLNIYCDNALINGLGHRAERVTLPIAREALRQFRQSMRQQSGRLRWIGASTIVVVLAALGATALMSPVLPWIGRSSEKQIASAPAAPPTEPPRIEVVTVPSEGAKSPAGLSNSPVASASAVTTTVEAVAPPARTDAAAPLRPDQSIGVVVRRGDTLLQLCRNVYGKCGSATLRLVLETNPQIRHAHSIASGQKLVFPPPPAETGAE